MAHNTVQLGIMPRAGSTLQQGPLQTPVCSKQPHRAIMHQTFCFSQ